LEISKAGDKKDLRQIGEFRDVSPFVHFHNQVMKVFLSISVIILTVIIQASGADKGIADYFLELPPHEFEATTWQIVDSIRNGRGVIDSRNGYMFLDGDEAQVSLEIALFLYPDREPLLAVAWAEYMEGSEAPPYQIKNFTHLSFYRERSGKMVPADRAILPVRDYGDLRFELPRKGLTVVIRDSSGKAVSQWTWVRTRFLQD
jgi:hypothetical protein